MTSPIPPASGPGATRARAEKKRASKKSASGKVATIAEEIAARIEAGEWRDEERLPSRNQFACEYDVSPQTISHVMQRLQQKGMLYVVPNRGVFISEATATQNGGLHFPPIGIRGSYMPTVLQEKPTTGYMLLIIRSIWEAAQRLHAPLMLLSSQTTANRLTPRYCQSLGLKGVVFIGGETHREAIELREAGIPVILGNEPLEATPLNFVDYDHARALEEVIEQFVAHGHRRIAVIAPNSSVDSFYSKFKPVYIEALCRHGIEKNFNSYWRFVQPDFVENDAWCTAVQAAMELMALPEPPTAIFIFSQTAANSVHAALQAAGKKVSIASAGYSREDEMLFSGFVNPHDELGVHLLEGIHRSLEAPFHFVQKRIPMKFVDKGTIHTVTPMP